MQLVATASALALGSKKGVEMRIELEANPTSK
jgi:hypothetical protein